MREITLALGGGGIKGYAHVGVLRVLEREGFHIRAIAGTSAGGMVGACYAAGASPDEMEKYLLEADQGRLYTRLPGDGPAMMGLGGVLEMLSRLLGDKTFQDVRLPLAVTAVNLETAQLVALRRGRLLDAVLATIAVPGIFPPRRWEGQTLVDGGILDPVPVALARYLAPALPVAAVVLSPSPEEWARPTPPRLFASLPFVSSYLGRTRMAQALNIFLRSIDIAGLELTELRLQVDQPEVILRPAVPHIGFMDSVNVREVVELGEQAAEQALPELRRAASLRGWFSQRASRRRTQKTVLDWEKEC
ncbi:MAG TPA: patatin-like phospholipase family protein [Anaerolineales bacterium]